MKTAAVLSHKHCTANTGRCAVTQCFRHYKHDLRAHKHCTANTGRCAVTQCFRLYKHDLRAHKQCTANTGRCAVTQCFRLYKHDLRAHKNCTANTGRCAVTQCFRLYKHDLRAVPCIFHLICVTYHSRNQTQTRVRQSRNRLFVAGGSKARESEVIHNPRQKAIEWSIRMVNNGNQNGNGPIKGQSKIDVYAKGVVY